MSTETGQPVDAAVGAAASGAAKSRAESAPRTSHFAAVDPAALRASHGPGHAIELVGVAKRFHSRHGDVTAVDRVDLTIGEGEFFSLLGPSGCGKTTTLRMIGGFEEPTAGRILLHGKDVVGVPANQRDVNMVFQSYALFPHLTVFDNIAFGLRRKSVRRVEIRRRVGEMLDLVELSGKADRRPSELSGGQQQRVALARALVNRPQALLLDEPLAALDLKLRQAMQLELKRIQREVGITFVFVTHDQNEALTMSDRLVVMSNGRIEQLGAPREVYEHPRTRFVAGFIGTSNLVSGVVAAVAGGMAVLQRPADESVTVSNAADIAARPGDRIELTIRPEKIRITPERPPDDVCAIRARVGEIVYQGAATQYKVTDTSGQALTAFVQNAADSSDVAERGGEVWLSWRREHSFALVPPDGGGPTTDSDDPEDVDA